MAKKIFIARYPQNLNRIDYDKGDEIAAETVAQTDTEDTVKNGLWLEVTPAEHRKIKNAKKKIELASKAYDDLFEKKEE